MEENPTNRNNGERWGAPLVNQGGESAGEEYTMLQEILQEAPSPIAREFLLHYYISAKSWPLVLLVGQPGVNMQQLFYLLAQGVAGCSDGQIRLLPARFPHQAPSQKASYFDALQGRFSTMSFLDLLAEASAPGNEGRTYFLCLDQATPPELDGYIALYLSGNVQNQSIPPLPRNLYLTATVSVEGGVWCLPSVLLNRAGIVEVSVPLSEQHLTSTPRCPPVGWQRTFLRSTIRDPEQGRHQLQRFGLLAKFQRMWAALQPALPITVEAARMDGLLLYLANSFTAEGQSLLDKTAEAGLRQALDIQLCQILLPCIEQHRLSNRPQWKRLIERLEGDFPRAHARARRLEFEYAVILDHE